MAAIRSILISVAIISLASQVSSNKDETQFDLLSLLGERPAMVDGHWKLNLQRGTFSGNHSWQPGDLEHRPRGI